LCCHIKVSCSTNLVLLQITCKILFKHSGICNEVLRPLTFHVTNTRTRESYFETWKPYNREEESELVCICHMRWGTLENAILSGNCKYQSKLHLWPRGTTYAWLWSCSDGGSNPSLITLVGVFHPTKQLARFSPLNMPYIANSKFIEN